VIFVGHREFPPVMFDVEVNGKKFEEMHVDGSTTAQVFVYWSGVQLAKMAEEHGAKRERKIYVLCNARLDPGWGEVERRTLPITFRAIATGFGATEGGEPDFIRDKKRCHRPEQRTRRASSMDSRP
jgi:hypothetical protein